MNAGVNIDAYPCRSC